MLVAAVTLPSRLHYPIILCIVVFNILTVYGFCLSNLLRVLRLRFPDVETNPRMRRPVLAVSRILCGNVRGLSGNLSDLGFASA